MALEDKHSRTEPPTPKRKREARQRGQVARSPEVAGWASALAASFLLPWLFRTGEHHVLDVVAQAADVMRHPTVPGAAEVLGAGLRAVIDVVWPIGAVFVALAVVANLAQVGRSFSLKAARPRLSRISPKSGVRNLVGPQMLLQLAKQTIKVLLLGVIGYQSVDALYHAVAGDRPVGLAPILAYTVGSLLRVVRVVSGVSLAVGLAEFAYQKRHLAQSLKMTKVEVKEEAKSSEGDPHVRGEVRRRGYLIARSKMLASVRSADVVVTNPTHYAVALEYRPGTGSAPRVVAKGAGALARAIRDRAAESEVPIVEDPPLARYLYATCEVDQQIPTEIYLAVARLLAFVYALPAPARTSMVHRPARSELPSELEALTGLASGRRRRAEQVLAGTVGT